MSRFHVPRHWLLILAGITWVGVGFLLCYRAWQWLGSDSGGRTWFEEIGAFALAFGLYSFALSKVAERNIARIDGLPDRTHVGNFIPLKSYLMIVLMIALGVWLRSSSLSRELLIVPYTAMGGALILGGAAYLRSFFSSRLQ